MGSAYRKPKAGIYLKNPTVLAGEEVVGTVYLLLEKRVKNLSILLDFTGQEKVTYMTGGECDWHNNQYDYPTTGSVLISNKDLKAGTYSFPFTLKTLKSLPGTMETYDSYHKASINYCLAAKVLGNNFSLCFETPVVIKERLSFRKFSIKQSKKAEVKFFHFFNRGNSELQLELKKDSFEPNEEVNMTINVDNTHSELPMKSLEFVLHRVVNFEYSKGCMANRHQEITSSSSIINVNQRQKSIYAKFFLNIKEGFLNGLGTSKGKIIDSNYFLEVSASFGAFSSKIKSMIPINLLPADTQGIYESTIEDAIEMPISTIDMN